MVLEERKMGLWVLRERKRDFRLGRPWSTVRKEEESKRFMGL